MKNDEYDLRFVEWYAKYIWRFHRLFLGKTLSKRCKKCAIPEPCSPLKDGVCEICRSGVVTSYGPNPEVKKRMSEELDQLFKSYEADEKLQFHCLVLMSGGKDSTYLLHQLKTKYPRLRIIALTVNNSFLPQIALANAQRVIKALRVPSIMFQPDPAFYEKVFRHAFLNLNNRLSAVVVDQCDGDILHDTGRNIAAKFGIPLVVSGIQAVQVELYVGQHNYETSRAENESTRTNMAGFELASLLTPSERAYLWDATKFPKKSIPRMLFPFYAWEYTERDVYTTLERTGLLQKKKASTMATNHKLIPLMGAVDIARFGYSSYDPEFANLIRAGLADKTSWQTTFEIQEYAMKKNRFVKDLLDEVLERLSLTRKQLGLKE